MSYSTCHKSVSCRYSLEISNGLSWLQRADVKRPSRKQNNPLRISVASVRLLYRKNLSLSLERCYCCFDSIFQLRTMSCFTGEAGFVCITLRACSHDPGTTHCPEAKLTPGSVSGLTPVTVHMSFSLPRGNFERRVPVVQHRVTRLAVVTFLHVNRMQKLPRGKSSLANAHY